MADSRTFTADQAAQITTVLRKAAGLEPQEFALHDFIGMISDEIELLRNAGKSDDEIASLLAANGVTISAEELREGYVPTEERTFAPDG